MNPPSLADVATFPALCAAARLASRGRRNRMAMARFLFHLETEVLQLERELRDRTYRPRPYHTFTVSDPKPRAISAADPRDRVVHHALCGVLEPILEAAAWPHGFACRPGKGSHAAVRRARTLVARYRWFAKLDVRKFFETTDHEVLKAALAEVVVDEGLLWLAGVFIDHGAPGSGPGRGLPIGNLTSQHFANFYLAPLDRLVAPGPPADACIRYMDDLVLFADSRADAWDRLGAATACIEGQLRLAVKQEVTIVAPCTEGLPFLGFRVFPGCVRLDRRSRARLVEAARRARAAFAGPDADPTALASAQSAFAHAVHADTLALRRSLVEDPGRDRGRQGLQPGEPRR